MILNDLTPEKFLSKDEERKIIALCKQDNLIAKRRLILSNIRYIYAQAQKLCKNQNQIDELVMEGIIGLLKAIPKFETDRKVRFITFASFWIKKEMLDSIYNNCSSFHLSSSKARLATKIKKLVSKFSYLNEQNLIIQKVCNTISCTEKEVIELLDIIYPNISLDSIATTENNITIMEFIEDGSICPEEEFIQKEEINCLMKAFNKLTQIEKDVLIRHYGLFNQPIQTFGEIAELQNKSKARIHQIETQAKEKLRKIIA